MRIILIALALVGAMASTVWADCTMHTIILPDGSVRFVQTCCYGGQCTTIFL